MKKMIVKVVAGLVCCLSAGAGDAVSAVAPSDTTGTQKPFLCDKTTGYLLQCSFLSPRPYCWPNKETVILSGWDVDKSGGDFDYKPTGEINKDFRFHSEWFKLVDTSTTAAVTLKHQLARQTEGRITIEFRFRMPKVMDGASWQLRDLDQAGVSLLVRGGNLCWGNGMMVVPLEVNRDYGVKVVADITGKKADGGRGDRGPLRVMDLRLLPDPGRPERREGRGSGWPTSRTIQPLAALRSSPRLRQAGRSGPCLYTQFRGAIPRLVFSAGWFSKVAERPWRVAVGFNPRIQG